VLIATRSVNVARIAMVATEVLELSDFWSTIIDLLPEPDEGDDPSAHKLRDTSIILAYAAAGGLLMKLAIGLGDLWMWGAVFGGLCGAYHVAIVIPSKKG
jgi:hypothetical protein